MAAKIQCNDEVIVISGQHKGERGTVKRVIKSRKKGQADRLIIEGVALATKHQKPNPQLEIKGGIIKQEKALFAHSVAVFNAATGKADRVGFRVEDGKKVRFYKSNNQIISK